jgi:hypothetical protein
MSAAHHRRATVRLDRDDLATGHLPLICMHCGEPATQRVEHQFRTGAGGHFLFLPGLVVWSGVPTPARVPLCDRHLSLFQRPLRVILGTNLFIITAVLLLALITCLGLPQRLPLLAFILYPLLVLAAFTAMFAGIIWLISLRRQAITCIRTTRDTVTLTNVSEAFIDALEQESGGQRCRVGREEDEDLSGPRSRVAPWANFLAGGLLASLLLVSVLFLGCCGLPLTAAGLLLWESRPSTPQATTPAPQPVPPPVPRPGPRAQPLDPNIDEARLTRVWLADLPEIDPKVGWGTFGKHGRLGYAKPPNRDSNDPITVEGQPSPHGLSMVPPSHGFSTVKYRLNGEAKVFRATVAVNDLEGDARGPVTPLTFKVFGDGELLWESGAVQTAGKGPEAHLNIAGVDLLELQVACPGDFFNARALWLEAQILK